MKRIGLIIFGDFVAFWATFLIILFTRFGAHNYQMAISTHLIPFIILYLFWILIFYLFNLYDLFTIKPTIPHLNRFIMAIIISFVVGIFLFYFAPIFGISPKTNLIFQVVGFGVISFAIRRVIYTIFSKKITRPVILIGTSKNIDEIKDVISINPQLGMKLISHVNSFSEISDDHLHIKNAIFIFENIKDELKTSDILDTYKNGTEIISVTQAYEKYLGKIPISCINQSWIIENINIKENFVYTIAKKIIDIIIAFFIIIITSPILIIAIIARLIEDGRPIFYKQKRVGLNGRIFNLYKLRSMVVLSPDGSAEITEVKWCTGHDDARITKVGRIMRNLHIDEIPQMINIIKGDISLVGPRPERPEFVCQLEKTIPHYELRHIIRPGFTGWAQIKYKYADTMESSKEKFRYDLYYIKNRNIFIDFGIILRTIQIIFTH